MTKHYEHVQVGYLIVTGLSIAMFISIYLMVTKDFNMIAFVVLIILGITIAMFTKLITRIEDDVLEIRFGLGIINKRFPLKDIESCQIVKNHWYYGWGIHLTPHGWLYNVSGWYAVKITMKTGKKYLIGTDVPNELENAIQKSIDRIS